MDRLLEAFRQGLQGAGLRAGLGVRYPQALRELAVAYFHEAHRQGRSRRRAAEALGVSDVTLSRWIEEAGPDVPELVETAALREVVVTDSRPRGSLSLVTPEGYRVEGLGVAELAEVLRALR